MENSEFALIRAYFDQIDIFNIEHLEMHLRLLFEKAVSGHESCDKYAELCVHLRGLYPEFETADGEKVTFTRVLLSICQAEFEKLTSSLDVDHSVQHRTQGQKRRFEKQFKEQMLGNMKFIGHLFLRRLLSHKVVVSIVEQLLHEEEFPEALFIDGVIVLIQTVGATIELSDSGKIFLNALFDRLKSFKGIAKYPQTLKHSIQDLLDLRSNGWQINSNGGKGNRGKASSPARGRSAKGKGKGNPGSPGRGRFAMGKGKGKQKMYEKLAKLAANDGQSEDIDDQIRNMNALSLDVPANQRGILPRWKKYSQTFSIEFSKFVLK